MRLTEVENARLLAQLRGLTDEQWTAATDCTGWTVRDVAVHLIASAQAQANPAEFARQVFTGRRLTAEIGGSHWVDGVNEAQLRSRTSWSTMMLPEAWQRHSAAALKARLRMPAPVRALPLLPIGTGLGVHIGWQPLGYLFDMGFTRDVWVHRIDIALAAGIPSELTPDHDGRIVADIVAEWSRCILWLTMAANFAEAKLFSFAEYPRWVRYLLYGLWLPALLGLAAPLAFVATRNNAPHGVVLMLWLFPLALASVFVVVFVYEAWTRRTLVSALRKGLLRSVGWLLWVFYLLFMLVAQGPA